MVKKLSEEYPLAVVCKVLECARSTYYHHSKQKDDTEIRRSIESVAERFPRYGYRRTYEQLQREGVQVGEEKVGLLMKEMGLQQKKKHKKRRTTNSHHGFKRYPNLVRGLSIVRIDQVWVADITFVRLRQEFVYLAIIMDVTTRAIRGWNLSRSLDETLTLAALKQSLTTRTPEIHHSDQGVHYAAKAYTDLLDFYETQISMADVGQAWQNGYCERVIKTIKEEEVDLSDYEDYQDAYQQIGHFLEEVYMKKRIHSSLGYLTPAEFEEKCLIENHIPELLYK